LREITNVREMIYLSWVFSFELFTMGSARFVLFPTKEIETIIDRMNNKTIMGFALHRISRIIQTLENVISIRLRKNNIDLGLHNSGYHAQPHPIIVNKSIKKRLAGLHCTY
jgi:hypothetical protein